MRCFQICEVFGFYHALLTLLSSGLNLGLADLLPDAAWNTLSSSSFTSSAYSHATTVVSQGAHAPALLFLFIEGYLYPQFLFHKVWSIVYLIITK